MSGDETAAGRSDDATTAAGAVDRDRLARLWGTATRVLVGDRVGLVLLLGTVAFAMSYWRVGVFINDTYTLANALVSLADGHLWVGEAVYGPGLETPGMGVHDGRYYGRNYGQLVLALPFVFLYGALAAVVDPGLLFPALYGLLLVALGREAGRVLGRPSRGAVAGAALGLGVFAVNVAVAAPLEPRLLPVAALQTGSLLATGLAVATLYRLVARIHDRRTGIAAAAVTALATPVGFWATLPKRHALVLALVLGTCYALYRSREGTDSGALLSPLGFRAAAYALVGLTAWVHGGEAFAVLLALLAVDLPTAPANDRRSLALVGAVFVASLLPFLLTNALISGDPLWPPRFVKAADSGMVGASGTFGDGASTGGTSGTAGDSGGGVVASLVAALPAAVEGPLSALFARAGALLAPFVEGATVLLTDPGRLYRVFVRGGDIASVSAENHDQTIYLTMAEAAPVVAGVVAVGAAGVGRALATTRDGLADSVELPSRDSVSPAGTADAFLALVALAFLLVYVVVLPNHAQLTVRYLHLLYAVAVYAAVRLPSLRRVLATHWRTGLWTWAGSVLLGSQAFVAVVAVQSLGQGEAVQVHALVGLAGAVLFAVLAVGTVVTERLDRAAAVAAGLAAGLGTDFLLLSGLAYFQYGQYALPAAGWVADLLATA